VPSGNHAEIAALFHNRVTINTIRQWRVGRRAMPRWAWDILKARAAPIDEIVIGVGREVSKYNLPMYKEKARQTERA
jgi:protein gp37